MATLGYLVESLPEKSITGNGQVEIAGITYDSRTAGPGYLFVCIKGDKYDGHDFIADAMRRGARAIVVERNVDVEGLDSGSDSDAGTGAGAGVAIVEVPDARRALGALARAFYDNPSGKLTLVGVTGTNGKTTTTYLVKAVFEEAGYPAGVIGTIQNVIGREIVPAKHTTPESSDLEELLDRMVRAGVKAVAMEVSSHAIALDRIFGLEFDIGVFTNITQDHLDFHKTFDNYVAAKAKFFKGLGADGPYEVVKKRPKAAVVNMDDPNFHRIIEGTPAEVITYGIENEADIRAFNITLGLSGISFDAATPAGTVALNMKLRGMFNIYNALAAIGAGLEAGLDIEHIKRGLERVGGVPGRFESVDVGQDFAVIVDYAHTPDGLENILKAARQFVSGRKIVVFGCGGDRDRTKRPIMGRIAASLADHVILTSDNPRSEDPASICAEIEAGVRGVRGRGEGYEVIVDRRSAIERAVNLAGRGDIVIIAGKGHETYQIFRDRTIHFDDREVARDVLEERVGHDSAVSEGSN
ncbi:MAG: UDP-N-acetylmuramoyl-L-alanyl-D-glutamate--2,6-diaminopimelate ligase [Firmicutes bacterium]|nr:UDP-N-acetylmuramoyl-L-alanyl-D-glutamate--2,6-diaminopimelate ligase [Bacillota bacterium]